MPDLDSLFGFLGVGLIAVVLAVYVVILMFPLLYVILRWRAGSPEQPGLGTRASILFLRSLTVLTLLTAGSLFLQTFLSKEMREEAVEWMQRTALGLGVGGAVLLMVQQIALFLLPAHTHDEDPASRVFRGVVALLTGTVSSVLVILWCVLFFEDADNSEAIRKLLAWLVLWMPAHMATILLLARGTRRT